MYHDPEFQGPGAGQGSSRGQGVLPGFEPLVKELEDLGVEVTVYTVPDSRLVRLTDVNVWYGVVLVVAAALALVLLATVGG